MSYDLKNDLKETSDRLNSVSQSFCLAKWLQVTLHLHEGTNHSCHHPKVHTIPLDEIETSPDSLHNTEFKKAQRNLMLNGVRPKECNYCWTIEDLPSKPFSDRIIKSNDDWARADLDRIAKLPASQNINPRYIEVAFSRACNFKCSYCSARVSSSWDQELKKYGNFDIQDSFYFQSMTNHIRANDRNPYVEAFWNWWPDLVRDLKWFRITGGEPLLSQDTFKVLDFLNSSNRPFENLNFAVNSNLGVDTKLVENFAQKVRYLMDSKKLKSFIFYFSIDSWGSHAEYIRWGLKINQFEQNLSLLQSMLPDIQYSIMCTYNAISPIRFLELLEKIRQWKLNYSMILDISILRNPRFLDIHILPKRFQSLIEESIEFMNKNSFYDYEISKLKRVLDYYKNEAQDFDVKYFQKDFAKFFSEVDKRRGSSYQDYIPELSLDIKTWLSY